MRHCSWAALLLVGCAAKQRDLPPTVEIAAADPGRVRLLLVGDTGAYREGPSDASTCDPDELRLDISAACRARLTAEMAAEQTDAVVGLGDLIYFSGPICPKSGLTDDARARLDDLMGDYLGEIGPPVLIALGNHDVHQSRWGAPGAERCYRGYSDERDDFVFPERTYTARFGPVLVGVLDTNRRLHPRVVDQLRGAIEAHRASFPAGWVVLAGHHPVRTYRDNAIYKALVGKWFRKYEIQPDLYANGHAHFLQLGVFDGVPAVTSGSGAKAYRVAECVDGTGPCGPGERFTYASWGYAVAELAPDRLSVTFSDVEGTPIYAWERSHLDPEGNGGPVPGAVAPAQPPR